MRVIAASTNFAVATAFRTGIQEHLRVNEIALPWLTPGCVEEPLVGFIQTGVVTLGSMCFVILAMFGLARCARSLPDVATQSTGSRPQMKALDGLRTVLIMKVIVYHIALSHIAKYGTWFPFIIRVSNWPMQFFFVLSGFINVYVTQGKSDYLSVKDGMLAVVRRFARLLPAYYIALTMCWWYAKVLDPSVQLPFSAWPLQALGIQAVIPQALQICGAAAEVAVMANGNGWFTGNMLLFSALFPLLYNCLPRGQISRTTAVLLAVLTVRSMVTVAGYDMYTYAPLRLLEFTAGMLGAQVASQWSHECRTWPGWGRVFDAALAIGCVIPHIEKYWFPLTFDGPAGHGDYYVTAVFVLVCVASQGIVEAKAQGTHVSSILWAMFESWPLPYLSKYAFSAYIVQWPVLKAISLLEDSNPSLRQFWPFYSIAPWLLGALITTYVEAPIQRYVSQWLRAGRELRHK